MFLLDFRIRVHKIDIINIASFFCSVLQCCSGHKCDLQQCFVGKVAHAEQLQFREQALIALLSMLGENIQRYREESTKLDHLTEKLSYGMPGTSQLDNKMVINILYVPQLSFYRICNTKSL